MVDDKTVKLERFDKTAVYSELSHLPEPPQQKKKWSKQKKIALIAGGFIFSFLLLYFMTGYYHDEQLLAEQQQIHQKELDEAKQKQLALEQQKRAAEANSAKFNQVKDKAEFYLKDVNLPKKEEVQQTVNEAEKQVEKAVAAAQNAPKVQTAVKEHSALVLQVTQFLQEQKAKLQAFFNQQSQKADKP
jgi:uncharacterized protein (DUF2126 family)